MLHLSKESFNVHERRIPSSLEADTETANEGQLFELKNQVYPLDFCLRQT
jgi:hypothetical protein